MLTTTTATNQTRAGRHALDHDDHALVRVPESDRYPWWQLALQRFGQLSTLGHFSLAAMLGMGMRFVDALLAIAIGCVLLSTVAVLLGIAGMREGLSTTLLARWSGFGARGSILVGLAITVGLTGWFAVQTQAFATGLHGYLPDVELRTVSVVAGLVITLIVVHGFVAMGRVAAVAVPVFVALAAFTSLWEVQRQGVAEVLSAGPAGPPLSLTLGTTIVVGGFILGAVISPDLCRYHRNARDVVTQTVLSVTLGYLFVGGLGVLLAHALKVGVLADAPQVLGAVQSGFGLLGVALLVTSVLPVNGWNVYPSSLAAVNAVHAVRGLRLRRGMMAVVFGVAGSALSALDWSDRYQAFLIELGAVFPPIAAVMIADYYVLQTWRPELDESRARGVLPGYAPRWVSGGLLAWAAGYVVAGPHGLGRWLDFKIPALTSFLVAFGAYLLAARFGLAGKGRDELEHQRGSA